MRKCLFCVAGLYAGPWFVGSVFKASSERSVPSGISAVMWERYVPSVSSRLSFSLLFACAAVRKQRPCFVLFFYLFRNSESAIRGHQFFAVIEELHYCFWAHKWIAKLFFNNTTTKVLHLQFVLGAARLVVVRLVGCLRRNGLAGCWDGSVLLDVWGKYSRSPCSFVCLVIGESRRYLH